MTDLTSEERRARHRERQHLYALRHPERVKETRQKVRAALQSDADKLEEHRAKKREYQRLYRQLYPDRVANSRKKYYEANGGKIKMHQREYARRPDVRKAKNAYYSQWKKDNKEKVNAWQRAYRAARKGGAAKLLAVGEALQVALGQNTLYAAALAAVPRRLPHHVREDVVSDLVLAVLEGEIAEADLARVAKSFISKHYRDSGFHTTRSLDAPIPGMDGRTYLDTISNEHAGAFQ